MVWRKRPFVKTKTRIGASARSSWVDHACGCRDLDAAEVMLVEVGWASQSDPFEMRRNEETEPISGSSEHEAEALYGPPVVFAVARAFFDHLGDLL